MVVGMVLLESHMDAEAYIHTPSVEREVSERDGDGRPTNPPGVRTRSGNYPFR